MLDPIAVFTGCYAAYLADDWDLLAHLFAEDIVLEDPSAPSIRGREAVIAHHQGIKRAFPDIGGQYDAVIGTDQMAAGRKTLVGTHTGPLVTADGRTIPPTGRRIEIPESDWMLVHDGRCARHMGYYDRMLLLHQLGLL